MPTRSKGSFPGPQGARSFRRKQARWPPHWVHRVALASLAAFVPIVRTPFVSMTNRVALTHNAVLVAGHRRYELQVVTTPAQQQLGLGDRASMPVDDGMLFVFPTVSQHCFWMKGMRFPLDIVWLSSDDRVVLVKPHLLPQSYPSAYCADSGDVVELNAGQARASGIVVGRAVKVELPTK